MTKAKAPAPVCHHRNRHWENRRIANLRAFIIRCAAVICKLFALCAAWLAFAALCGWIEGAGTSALLGLAVGVLSALGWLGAGLAIGEMEVSAL